MSLLITNCVIFSDLYLIKWFYIIGTVHQSPICSVFVINPDRVWGEPWRFLTYGMIHNNLEHILTNSFCQLLFGISLEMTNNSWRIAIVYISGIFLGGLLRETFSSHNNPLAGASGKNLSTSLLNIFNSKYCLKISLI